MAIESEQLLYVSLQCSENNLNLCINTELVTPGKGALVEGNRLENVAEAQISLGTVYTFLQ